MKTLDTLVLAGQVTMAIFLAAIRIRLLESMEGFHSDNFINIMAVCRFLIDQSIFMLFSYSNSKDIKK